MSNWIVCHDLIGIATVVTGFVISDQSQEDLSFTVTPFFGGRGAKPMRFTQLEAVLLAAQLDRQLQERVAAEHPVDTADWLGNYGIWYADQIVQ